MIKKLMIRLLLKNQSTYSNAIKVNDKSYLINIEEYVEPQIWIKKAKEQIGWDEPKCSKDINS